MTRPADALILTLAILGALAAMAALDAGTPEPPSIYDTCGGDRPC